MKAAIGVAIVVAHVVAFVALAPRCRGTDLEVSTDARPASPTPAFDAQIPHALADRVAVDDGPPGPGLHRRRWTVDYRGGFSRSVGAAQLVGPFQDPAARACTGRVVIGQRLLDGTLTAEVAKQLDRELRGASAFPVGDYTRIDKVTLRWAQLFAHPDDVAMVGPAPRGYVRVTARVVFDRVEVPIVAALVPEIAKGALQFRVAARAELDFGNRAIQWISDKLGGDKLATHIAREQLDDALVTTLAPPPPFDLPDGQTLRFSYCDEPPEMAEGAWAALPFAVELGRVAADATVLPPKHGPIPRPAPSPTTSVALDLDLDALNALLYELWRSGFLDRRLAEVGLDRKFNADPTVREYLTIRISPVRLALPPVVSVGARGLHLAAEARVAIADGEERTIGRVWGGLDFTFAPHGGPRLPIAVDLGALELSCERTATTLVPCYADLVGAMRGRGDQFHGALTDAFAKLLADIFVDRRLGATGLPSDLVIRGAAPSISTHATNATLHLELDASLAPAK
jgi:hypothetical protein